MEKLTEFKPIQKLCLPNLGQLSCAGLIVIVGPNSSGKSQLLKDISQKISGEPRELVVAAEFELAKLDHQLLIKCLRAEGYISSFWDDNDREQYMPMTTAIGTGQGAQNVGSEQLEQWRSRSENAARGKRKDEYFGWFSRFLVTALFLENRLTSMSAANTIDFETQPPTHDLHALHLNDPARAALTREIQRAFSKAIWSDTSKGNQICLRISESGQVPTAEDRLSVREMAKYRTLASEGDGLKSYVATVISVLLGRRPVSVIDEPEMCLHPPQAYNLGQFIGTNGTSKQTATFVATHSSQILRGVLQTAERLQIVRLTRSQTGFSAKHVDSTLLEEAMRKPTVRAETVLDGIFAQAVAIIEADGDRIVYQSAWEVVGQNLGFDIHFAAVGGTGGIADTCQLYKMLGIPVAIIADLDLITDVEKLKVVLKSLSEDHGQIVTLIESARRVSKALQELPPTITEEQIRATLAELSSKELDWSNGDDRDLRRSLTALSNRLNGMRGLKRGGINALPEEISEHLRSLLHKCNDVGLFLVPVGELEYWLSEYGISASKVKKWAWANEAADFLRTNSEKEGDIWAFMRAVGQYLTEQFH
jgi:hypothetical protein